MTNGTAPEVGSREGRKRSLKDQLHLWLSFFRKVLRLRIIRVSKIHLFEAKERWWSLRRLVDYETSVLSDDCDNAKRQALVLADRVLVKDEELITRNESDLNRLWRSLTRVRVLMISNVFSDEQLASQLDTCREEAFRLRVESDTGIGNLLERIAELTDERAEKAQNRTRLVRALKAAFERFNSLRVERIHHQYVNIRTYIFALLFLLPTSCMLLSNHETITHGWPRQKPEKALTASTERVGARTDTQAVVEGEAADRANGTDPSPVPSDQEPAGRATGVMGSSRRSLDRFEGAVDWLKDCLAGNILAFVFFGGFSGGLFSVAMRARSKELMPGDDAYFIWYVLTKPIVGALGAVLLFILLGGGVVNLEFVRALAEDLKPSVNIFSFAIVSGFSERIVFPELR